jgi:hypothetical protein
VNRENIKRVRDHIASLPPKRFDMSWWAINRTGAGAALAVPSDLIHDCGTAGCIGGWTEALFPGHGHKGTGSRRAAKILSLSESQRVELFFMTGTGVLMTDVTLDMAVRVLDHLLATGEVKWAVAEEVTA